MSDLVTRLRGWRNWREVHIVRTHLLLEEAADEIERLSANGDCPAQDNAANRDILAADEREAVEECVRFAFPATHPTAATLRGLLERLK